MGKKTAFLALALALILMASCGSNPANGAGYFHTLGTDDTPELAFTAEPLEAPQRQAVTKTALVFCEEAFARAAAIIFQKETPVQVVAEAAQIAETADFDPGNVPEELYESTIYEVRIFIEKLNDIIRNRNYEAWKASLSEEFFAEISSPEHLHRVSETAVMRSRRIVLRTAEDFFMHVVVPSRANSRVDEIEFIDRNRVKAFTVTRNRAGQTQRLRLYDLEFVNDSWKIIN